MRGSEGTTQHRNLWPGIGQRQHLQSFKHPINSQLMRLVHLSFLGVRITEIPIEVEVGIALHKQRLSEEPSYQGKPQVIVGPRKVEIPLSSPFQIPNSMHLQV